MGSGFDQTLTHKRIDCLEGLCRSFQRALAQDQDKITSAARQRDMEARLKDPFGFGRFSTPAEKLNTQRGAMRRKW